MTVEETLAECNSLPIEERLKHKCFNCTKAIVALTGKVDCKEETCEE